MLSNTAVPYYYGKFREAVLRGEIKVNETVSMEMNRIDALIRDPNIYYDRSKVEGYIKYCENELTLTDGSDMKLLDTFKLWAEQVLCWYYFIDRTVYVPNKHGTGGSYVRKKLKRRLTTKQVLIIPRGGAKSMYGSTIHSYFLNIDRHSTEQIATAPTMRQAEEVTSPIKISMARSRGPLFKFLTDGSVNNTTGTAVNKVKLLSTKLGILNTITGSKLEIRPMSIDKLQGSRARIATIDEWLSGDTREDVIGAIEQGASKNDEYFILATSSEGTIRNGVGDTIKMELMDVLKGEYQNKSLSIWWYALDNIEEVGMPEMWEKAQPNIGKTVSYEVYHSEVERAEKVPSARNDILAKRFGLAMEGFTYYFTYEETLKHRPTNFFGCPCAMGIDLSQGDDFCAFTFVFPLRNGSIGVKTLNYISSYTMTKLPLAMRAKYDEFLKEGTLIVFDCTNLDMDEVYDDVVQHIDRMEYDVRAVGYDPYNAFEFINKWTLENGSFGVEKVIQGAKTESVPLGELKKLAENRAIIFDQEIMTFTMGNCVVATDSNANKKLYKKRNDQKIDSVAAMMDAYIAIKRNKDLFD